MVVPSGGSETATQLEYDVVFKKTGTHIVWYRAGGIDGGADSAWFHIDGDRDPNRVDGNQSSMTGFSGQLDFAWLSNPQDGGGQFTVDVGTPGAHVIGVARRENNAYFDKFIITTDPAFVPSGFGPPETREGLPAAPTVTLTGPTEGQKFPTGASITLSANASGAPGIDLARVEFSANGTVVGTATQSPFNFTWSGVKDGTYTIRAIATDEVGGATTSSPIVIKVGTPPPLIYFVTADPGPLTFAGDIAVQQRLLKRGFEVQIARGSDVPNDGSTARGSSLIIQSSSLGSGTVENNGIGKFRDLAIPAMVWEASSEDAFGFQEVNGATTADQTQINIVDSTHPLAAGLPKGLVTVSTSEPYSHGTPTGAHVIATLAGDASQAISREIQTRRETGPKSGLFFLTATDNAQTPQKPSCSRRRKEADSSFSFCPPPYVGYSSGVQCAKSSGKSFHEAPSHSRRGNEADKSINEIRLLTSAATVHVPK